MEDEFTVLAIERIDPGRVKALVEVTSSEDACPGCGVLTSRDRPVIAVKDLKVTGQVVDLHWRKRRLVCQEGSCARRSFTQQSDQIPARARVTILTSLTEDVTNARTEGFNRIIKDTKRVGCGYRNMANYRRRILAHIVLTRGHRAAA